MENAKDKFVSAMAFILILSNPDSCLYHVFVSQLESMICLFVSLMLDYELISLSSEPAIDDLERSKVR